MKIAILNLFFRGLSIAGRFLVLAGIGRYLTEYDLGIYGLIYSTIILALYFIGFDFYTFNTREIIAADQDSRNILIHDQLVFHTLTYIILLPLIIPVFLYNVLPAKFAIWIYLILIFEHLSQEFYRIFTALSRSVFANFVAFLRAGSWVIILGTLWVLEYSPVINLDSVLIAWSAGAFVSVIASVSYLKFLKYNIFRKEALNWSWIKEGLITALPFFIASLSYKIVEHSNRFYIDFFHTKDMVGIFTFFAGIANVVSVMVFTTVIMVAYPKMYQLYIKQDLPNYFIEVKKYTKNVILMSLGAGLLTAFLIHPLLIIIGKYEIYSQSMLTFYLLVVANIIFNISLVPHYTLYVKKKDIAIMSITIVGMLVNLILNYFLIPMYAIRGAAISMIISFLIIFGLKAAFNRHEP